MASRASVRLAPARLAPVLLVLIATGGAMVGCATTKEEPIGAARKETAYAVTASNQLISFNAGQPQKLSSKKALKGLDAGEVLVGIDYRVARGQLYGLTSAGRLLRIDTAQATIEPIGPALDLKFGSSAVGFDFNPAVDRIRVVDAQGHNQRLHPDTGAMVDGDANLAGVQPDGALAYGPGDAAAGKAVQIVAAGYTYNKQDEKLTTNYAIDAAQGSLVMQGSREGVTPVVSPNTGRLSTVGSLGVPAFTRASFDIADLSNAAFLSIDASPGRESRWYQVDLTSGKAAFIGTIRAGEPVVGVAIEP